MVRRTSPGISRFSDVQLHIIVRGFALPRNHDEVFPRRILQNPARDRKDPMTETPPSRFRGIISGDRQRGHADVADRAARIAGGLQRLGAYGVPVNWHFKPEEINYILKDSGTSILIAHADFLHQLRDAIPSSVSVFSVPTPPEIIANYKIDPDLLPKPDFALDLETWLAQQAPYDGPAVPQPQNMIYTSGTTGHPKGVRRNAPTPEQSAN